MAIIKKITRANSGSAALDYARGKNQLTDQTRTWLRNQGISPIIVNQLHDRAVVMNGLNVDPEYAKSQMKALRGAWGTSGKEVTRVIQSFSTADLDASKPADWQTANDLGMELAQKAFPTYQVGVYTQLDGNGHKLHNHIIINLPDINTGKKYHQHREWEHLAKINDAISIAHGLSIVSNKLNNNHRYPNKIAPQPPETRTITERNISNKGGYVWKDDLRHRIDRIMSTPTIVSSEAFSAALRKNGIILHDRGQNVSYEFTDKLGKQRRARGKTLGHDYEKEILIDELERRTEQAEQQRYLDATLKDTERIQSRTAQIQQRAKHQIGRDQRAIPIISQLLHRDQGQFAWLKRAVTHYRNTIDNLGRGLNYTQRHVRRIQSTFSRVQQAIKQRIENLKFHRSNQPTPKKVQKPRTTIESHNPIINRTITGPTLPNFKPFRPHGRSR